MKLTLFVITLFFFNNAFGQYKFPKSLITQLKGVWVREGKSKDTIIFEMPQYAEGLFTLKKGGSDLRSKPYGLYLAVIEGEKAAFRWMDDGITRFDRWYFFKLDYKENQLLIQDFYNGTADTLRFKKINQF